MNTNDFKSTAAFSVRNNFGKTGSFYLERDKFKGIQLNPIKIIEKNATKDCPSPKKKREVYFSQVVKDKSNLDFINTKL